MASDAAKYGTFPKEEGKAEGEDTAEIEFEWESMAAPWALFLGAVVVIGKNAAALLLLYCTLLRGHVSKQNLMVCDPTQLNTFQTWGCEYTKAFLRAFPLLAMCVTLCIAMRLIVQQRAYYGFLKVGGLLDFKNVEGWRDPLLLALLVSVLHSVAHFALKLTDGNGDLLKESQEVATKFLAPYVVFLVFLYDSNDIEKQLVPLNKYVEEDPEHARRILGSIAHLDERVVQADVLTRDVIGAAAAAAAPGEPPGAGAGIEDVYKEVIRSYPEVQARIARPGKEQAVQFYLRDSLWPAVMLIDGRLQDEKSASFRRMFRVFLAICTLVQFVVFALFFHQALIKDLYHDVYRQGEHADLLGASVLLAHAAFVAWIMRVTLVPVMASSMEHDAHLLRAKVGTAGGGG